MPLTPRRGLFLIASPALRDPNFVRTVVLLIDHNSNGSLGLIVNRRTDLSIDDVFGSDLEIDRKIHFGGPVESNRLFVLHRHSDPPPDSHEVCTGVHFGGDLDSISAEARSRSDPDAFRGYLGCAGWGEGQLEQELSHDSWILLPATADRVFDPDPEGLWSHLLSEMGGDYLLYSMMPPDPDLN